MFKFKLAAALLPLFVTLKAIAVPVTAKEAHELGVEAYLYFYPLVTMEISRRQFTNSEPGKLVGRGPVNTFSHMRAFPGADFKEVVRPNFDTLYSSGWLDLTKEPMIVSAPNTNGRYYMLPMMDMWSDVFAVPGARTTGTEEKHFAVVPQKWTGKLPAGVERIEAPTPHLWIIGRTQTNGEKDYGAVHKVQDGYKITPLSQWKKKAVAKKFQADPSVDMKTPALEQVNGMTGEKFFEFAASAMKQNPPHITDWSQIQRLKRIGIEPGKDFKPQGLATEVRDALNRAAAEALKTMVAKVPTLARVADGWQMNTDTMGVYGNYYLKRAIVAMVGLGANQPEDAVYPMAITAKNGKAIDGNNKYVLHFEKDQLPPVSAFWSVTMYDQQGFQSANSINRFAIGDRDSLKYNSDGSLDLYLQNESPGKDKESNWLPAPKGPLGVTMRLYGPKLAVLDGKWNPPALVED